MIGVRGSQSCEELGGKNFQQREDHIQTRGGSRHIEPLYLLIELVFYMNLQCPTLWTTTFAYVYENSSREVERRQIIHSQGCRDCRSHVVQFSHSVNETNQDMDGKGKEATRSLTCRTRLFSLLINQARNESA